MRFVVNAGIIAATIGLSLNIASACTDFCLNQSSGYRISARTMDMESGQIGYDSWALVVYPRNHQYKSKAPKNRSGLQWTSRYGFVGVTSTEADGESSPHDGLNEKGLGLAMNWLVGSQFGQPISDDSALQVKDLALWVLGNCATCAEASEGLGKLTVWSKNAANEAFHLAIHDAEGTSIVIQWIDGEMNVYDNTAIGIMTNGPEFPFYIERIKYYEWQQTLSRPAIEVPGAWYPINRFLRTHFIKEGLPAPNSNDEAITQAVHILNAVQTPWGAPGTDSSKPSLVDNFDHTTWSVVRDHKNKVLYFRTVTDQQLHAVDLKKIDMNRRAVLSLEIGKIPSSIAIDVTSSLSP
jgi:choloylglycine hydrolase